MILFLPSGLRTLPKFISDLMFPSVCYVCVCVCSHVCERMYVCGGICLPQPRSILSVEVGSLTERDPSDSASLASQLVLGICCSAERWYSSGHYSPNSTYVCLGSNSSFTLHDKCFIPWAITLALWLCVFLYNMENNYPQQTYLGIMLRNSLHSNHSPGSPPCSHSVQTWHFRSRNRHRESPKITFPLCNLREDWEVLTNGFLSLSSYLFLFILPLTI